MIRQTETKTDREGIISGKGDSERGGGGGGGWRWRLQKRDGYLYWFNCG